MDHISYNSTHLDHILATHGEDVSLWNAPRDDSFLRDECPLSDELTEAIEGDPMISALISREIRENRLETLRRIFDLLFTNGRHPSRVVPNVYALALIASPDHLRGFTLNDLAELNSTTRQAFCIRMKKWLRKFKHDHGVHLSHPRKNLASGHYKGRSPKSRSAKRKSPRAKKGQGIPPRPFRHAINPNQLTLGLFK